MDSIGGDAKLDTSTQPDAAVVKCKLRWFQFSLRSLLIATALLAFILGTIIHFRTHFYVRYAMATGKFANVKPVPVSAMPESPEHEDWVRCRFGSLEFSLPPAMASNDVTPKKVARLRAFRDGPRSVIVELPEGTAGTEKFLQSETTLPPQGRGLSLPKLRLAWCQANVADFRWTMSQEELHWYAWCVTMNVLCRVEPDGWAETMFGGNLDGILLVRQSRHHASFDWQDNKASVAGYIYFKDVSAEPDPTWMRCVCKSVRVCDEVRPAKPAEKK